MSSNSQKQMPTTNAQAATRYTFNENTKTMSVDGFLAGKVGHKIEITVATTTVANDSEIYTFSDTAILAPSSPILQQIKLVYSDGTRATLLSAERIA